MDDNSFASDRIAASAPPETETETETGPELAAADRVLDITGEVCPMTFVRTRLALDGLRPGQTLLVLLRGDEPRARVPLTAVQLGHAVLRAESLADGTTRVLIRRA